ncbi:hypothetical protein FRB90_012756 [Tulasnella sp. 427]|nr:hypothetical protein FRB90_012756 [Tulasnella sp. 427]
MKDWKLEEGILRFKQRIYVPAAEEIKRQILELCHDSQMAGHGGQAKTLELVQRGSYWPSLKGYVNRYVEACDACQRNKPHYAKPIGLLKPLPIPKGPWQDVSYDFITKLPKTQEGNDTIMVVVDRLTKEAHFVATKEQGLNASKTAELFIANPNFSMAYHPQTDRQTERVNQNVEGYLRIYCNHRQDDWDTCLPFAEFAYNNSVHSSTGQSPFMANKGYNPMFTNMPSSAQTNPNAEERLERIESLQQEIQAAMILAQAKQKEFYDRHHAAEPIFHVGDKVWLSAENINTDRPSKKLSAKRLGPFLINTVVSTHAYELELPHTMRIHPVFHVSLLMPHTTDTIPGRVQEPPEPDQVEDHEEWEVEKILNSKKYHGSIRYLVRWKGFREENDTWEPLHLGALG